MARVNIYLPDDLAKRVREAGLNVSGIAQEALERELRIRDTDAWLDSLMDLPGVPGWTTQDTIEALDAVRAEAEERAERLARGRHRSEDP